MQTNIRRFVHFFVIGAVAGLIQSVLLIVVNEIGITEALMGGLKYNIPLGLNWLLYPRMVWGGLWGLCFLIPLLVMRRQWQRGLLIGVLPAVATWVVFNPLEGHGLLGLGIHPLHPVIVLVFGVLWGLLAGVLLDLTGARRYVDPSYGSEDQG